MARIKCKTRKIPARVRGVPKPFGPRFRPYYPRLREIRKYQKSFELLLPKAAFRKLVKDTTTESRTDIYFTKESILALQEAAEAYLVGVFEEANLLAVYGGRETIGMKEFEYVFKRRSRTLFWLE
mmetsp:Transcript_60379/g.68844  ORF Transcript_60379/g.68844 Transcript_60379/m.68844 type:complete len:125 (-) Transcript_60379:88-462(-)